jgi:hypothetical protein
LLATNPLLQDGILSTVRRLAGLIVSEGKQVPIDAKADVLDLVTLSINPANKNQYHTPSGWQNFTTHAEIIKVKGEQDTQGMLIPDRLIP